MTIKEFVKENEGVSGIYAWFCKETSKYYVGSSVNIGKRIGGEYNDFRTGKFCNSEAQADWDKFGEAENGIKLSDVTCGHIINKKFKYSEVI